MLTIAMFIFTMALVGMFYPYNRGALLSACVVLYALTAGISGQAVLAAARCLGLVRPESVEGLAAARCSGMLAWKGLCQVRPESVEGSAAARCSGMFAWKDWTPNQARVRPGIGGSEVSLGCPGLLAW